MKIKMFVFVFIIFFVFNTFVFSFNKLNVKDDECVMINYTINETVYKMPDKWYNIWISHYQEKINEGKKSNNTATVRNYTNFLQKLENENLNSETSYSKKGFYIGNNQIQLWCSDYNNMNVDICYYYDGKNYIQTTLGAILTLPLNKKEGWGNTINVTNDPKMWGREISLLGFYLPILDAKNNPFEIDNRLIISNINSNKQVYRSIIKSDNSDEIYFDYEFSNYQPFLNTEIPYKIKIDSYAVFDLMYKEKTTVLNVEDFKIYKVKDFIKDIYYPKENTLEDDSKNRSNIVFTYYPSEKSIDEISKESREKIKNQRNIINGVKIVCFIILLFIAYKLVIILIKNRKKK